MTVVPVFHTYTDPDDPVFPDQGECPHGKEIKRNGIARPGAAGRRLCDRCHRNR
jgi:hypothetical protein